MLCKINSEDNNHLFIQCSFSRIVWSRIVHRQQFKIDWAGKSFVHYWESWTSKSTISNRLAAITCWNIWNERNKVIFEDKVPSTWNVVYKTIGSFTKKLCPQTKLTVRQRTIISKDGYSITFFDGASSVGGINC
jgi:hypothetical protein